MTTTGTSTICKLYVFLFFRNQFRGIVRRRRIRTIFLQRNGCGVYELRQSRVFTRSQGVQTRHWRQKPTISTQINLKQYLSPTSAGFAYVVMGNKGFLLAVF